MTLGADPSPDAQGAASPYARLGISPDASFDADVLKADGPVLVDFWAEWCGPCKMIAPVLDELATEYAGKVTIGKVNIDEHQALAAQYRVTAIPTLLLFKDGKVVEQRVGAMGKSELQKMVDSHL